MDALLAERFQQLKRRDGIPRLWCAQCDSRMPLGELAHFFVSLFEGIAEFGEIPHLPLAVGSVGNPVEVVNWRFAVDCDFGLPMADELGKL